MAFTLKYFSRGKAVGLRKKIISSSYATSETITEAWERYQGYLWACPNHGEEFIFSNFYEGTTKEVKKQLNSTAKEDFCSLSSHEVATIIDNVIGNTHGIQEEADKIENT